MTNTATIEATDPRDQLSQDQVLMQWDQLKRRLADVKEMELEYRKYVVKRAFPQATEGTNTIELNNGYKLKAAVNYNYNLLANDVVEKCLDRISKIGNRGAFVAERLVSWTPSFLLTEYRKLQDEAEHSNEAKEILKLCNEMLTISEAAPTLTIAEPKVKK